MIRRDDFIDLEEPLAGVVVLSREDFDRCIEVARDVRTGDETDGPGEVGEEGRGRQVHRVDDETALRVAEAAGRANQPSCLGVVALLAPEEQRGFSASMFAVADEWSIDAGRVVATAFDMVAVELSGVASWLGMDARLAFAAVGEGGSAAAQPGRCCGPPTICVPIPPDPDSVGPGDPPYRLSSLERVAISPPIPDGDSDERFGRAGDYRARIDEGRPPVGAVMALANGPGPEPVLHCVRVVDPECTKVIPLCGPDDIGFTPGGQGETDAASVGSNSCVGGKPVFGKDVPKWCQQAFYPEGVPPECLGFHGGFNVAWDSRQQLLRFCLAAMPGPDSEGTICNPLPPGVKEGALRVLAGWVPGQAASKCEPIKQGGGQYCVECDEAGNCQERVEVFPVDPTVADIPTVTECVNPDGSKCDAPASDDGPTLGEVIKGVGEAIAAGAKAIGNAIGSLFSSGSSPPDNKTSGSSDPPGPDPDFRGTPGTGAGGSQGGSFQPGTKPQDLTKSPNQVGDPVELADGALRIDHVDLSFPGPARPLELRRTYRSTSQARSTLGSNWVHNWDQRIEPLTEDTTPDWLSPWCAGGDGTTTAVLHHRGDGGADLYLLDVSSGLYLPHAGATSTLAQLGDGWALRDPDGRICRFDADGYLIEDTDRFGNRFTVDYEPTPLGLLFSWHCAPERLSARAETLSHRRNALLAYLVGAAGRPLPDPSSWQVSAADFDPPHDPPAPDPELARQLAYARDLLVQLSSLGVLPESRDGARRKRPIRVTDPVGRTLTFHYVTCQGWDPDAPDPAAFDTQPDEGLLERVDGPGGTRVVYRYARPDAYPPALNEMFLTAVGRRDQQQNDDGLVPARSASYRFEYAWPGGATVSYDSWADTVEQRYLEYFTTFVGCSYFDLAACPNGGSQRIRRESVGDPADLARRAGETYASDVADNILTVYRDERIESETRFGTDPDDPQFDRVVAQRHGSSVAAPSVGPVAPDQPDDNWGTALPKTTIQWVDAGPVALGPDGSPTGERTEHVLPEAIRARYPLERKRPPTPPPASAPVFSDPDDPKACDFARMAETARQVPGWRPTVPYHDPPTPSRPAALLRQARSTANALIGVVIRGRTRLGDRVGAHQLRRTWLTPAQLVAAQVGDPTHNDVLSTLEPNPDAPTLPFVRRIVGRRRLVAANANRICSWARVTDRDGNSTWYGVNYRGQVLVEAEDDRGGRLRFTERLYNADGMVTEIRRPAINDAPWDGRTTFTYDEVDPTDVRGWAGWLPAFWARRANLVGINVQPAAAAGGVDDTESARPASGTPAPTFTLLAGRYVRITWEPLFNQPLTVEQGSLRPRWRFLSGPAATATVPQSRTDYVYDYQELSLKVPDDHPASVSGVLEQLRPWGFRWLRQDPAAFAWQLPVPLLGQDVNGDSHLGNRFAATAPPGGQPPPPEVVAARRAVGLPVAIVDSRPGVAGSDRGWLLSWAPHGLPGRIDGPDGEVLRHEYYPGAAATAPGPFGDGQSPADGDVNVGFSGMLARTSSAMARPGFPETGPPEPPCPALAGPYQWLVDADAIPANSPAEAIKAALSDLALPQEIVEDLLATVTLPNAPQAGCWTSTSYAYNVCGHPVAEFRPSGTQRTTTDTDGRVVEHMDAVGTRTETDWNRFGDAEAGRIRDPDDNIVAQWRAEYDEEGRIVYRCDAVEPDACARQAPAPGEVLEQRWRWLPEGALEHYTDPDGLQTLREYDSWSRLTLQSHPGTQGRRATAFQWNADDRLERIIYGGAPAPGEPTLEQLFTYDGLGRLVTTTDARGVTWQQAWSSRDLPTRRALGASAYGVGGPPPGWERVTAYDDHGRPVTVSAYQQQPAPAPPAATVVSRTSWTAGGALVSESADGAGITWSVHDLLGRLAWERHPDGTQTVRTWREAPHRIAVAHLRTGGDGTHRCLATITELDPRGIPTAQIVIGGDAAAGEHRATREYELDALGRVWIARGPLGECTELVWDQTSRIRQVRVERTPGGAVDTTIRRVNGRGELVGIVHPDGEVTTVGRDAFGEVESVMVEGGAAGVTRTYARDRLGRLVGWEDGSLTIRRTWSEPSVGAPWGDPVLDEVAVGAAWVPVIRRRFDEQGRLWVSEHTNLGATWLAEPDRTVRTTRAYDQVDRVVDETTAVGQAPAVRTTTTWSPRADGGWKRQRMLGAGAWVAPLVDQIDGVGRLLTRGTTPATACAFSWEGPFYTGRSQPVPGWNSPLREEVQVDAFGLPVQADWTALAVDDNGQPLDGADAARWAPAGWDTQACSRPLLRTVLVRDAIGRAVSCWWQHGHPVPADDGSYVPGGLSGRWRGASYDHRRWLAKYWEDNTRPQPPDLVPHEVSPTDMAGVAGDAVAWVYTREVVTGDLERIHGPAGERWALASAREAGHQLTAVTVDGNQVDLQHDPAGRAKSMAGTPLGDMTLVWHPTGQLAGVERDGQLAEDYLYDGLGRLVRVSDTQAEQVLAYDGHAMVAALDPAGRPLWEATWGPLLDQLTCFIDHTGPSRLILPLLDHQRSIVEAWDPDSSQVLGLVDWTPEGRSKILDSSDAALCTEFGGLPCRMPGDIPFGWTGAWRSTSTGLVWLRARWYSALLGQFLTHDPDWFVDGPNLYAYAAHDPINRTDPLGLGSLGPAARPTVGPGGYGGARYEGPTLSRARPVAQVEAGRRRFEYLLPRPRTRAEGARWEGELVSQRALDIRGQLGMGSVLAANPVANVAFGAGSIGNNWDRAYQWAQIAAPVGDIAFAAAQTATAALRPLPGGQPPAPSSTTSPPSGIPTPGGGGGPTPPRRGPHYIPRYRQDDPEVQLGQAKAGEAIPLAKHQAKGQIDVPLPDPAAQGHPHTALGGRYGTHWEGLYRQSATFTEAGNETRYNGHPVPLGRVDWTSHTGEANNKNPHADPHIHGYRYDRGDRGTLLEDDPQGFPGPPSR